MNEWSGSKGTNKLLPLCKCLSLVKFYSTRNAIFRIATRYVVKRSTLDEVWVNYSILKMKNRKSNFAPLYISININFAYKPWERFWMNAAAWQLWKCNTHVKVVLFHHNHYHGHHWPAFVKRHLGSLLAKATRKVDR